MSSITIKFKDGRVEKFPHLGRAGGSYSKSVSFEGSFVIITDEWMARTAFHAADIERVIEEPSR